MRIYKPADLEMVHDLLAEMDKCVEGIKSIDDVLEIINRYTGEQPCSGSLDDNEELLIKHTQE